MSEFNADKEYYNEYLIASGALAKEGWKRDKSERSKKTISTLFIKNGMAIWLLFGCEEDIKNEIL